MLDLDELDFFFFFFLLIPSLDGSSESLNSSSSSCPASSSVKQEMKVIVHQGSFVQSSVSITHSLKGHLVKCFTAL